VTRFDPDHHRDLRVEVPSSPGVGESRLARVAARLRENAADITDRAVADIRADIDAYRSDGVVPRDDLWWSVHRNVELVLRRIIEARPPSPDELDVRRELGVRRARQGFPLADLLRAFRLGYLSVWEILTEHASADGPDAVADLAQHAALVWGTMDAVSSAVADGYRATMETLDVDVRRRVLAFVSALRDERFDEATEQAASLDLEPTGRFAVAVCVGHRERLDTEGLIVAEEPDRTVALLAGADAGGDLRLARLLLDHGGAHVGTGLERHGLRGVASSLREAELAHRAALTLDRPVVSFADDWFSCLVLEEATSIRAVLGPAIEHLAGDPQAVATIEAFLAVDGNLTAAGRALNLHPNGVAYRLTRLAERTGLDLRTSVGVRDAYVALALRTLPE
jgi:hypothetical protein